MITPTTGAIKVTKKENMEGIPFAVKFFNDDHNLYISPSLFQECVTNNLKSLRYVVLSWRTDQISIDGAIEDLHRRVHEYAVETNQINIR